MSLGAVTAEAAVVTQDWSYNFGNEHIPLAAGPNGTASATGQQIVRSYDFAQFNPALGTLEKVEFSFSAGGTRILGFTHNGSGTGTLTANITQRFGFNLGGGLLDPSTVFQVNRVEPTSATPAGDYRRLAEPQRRRRAEHDLRRQLRPRPFHRIGPHRSRRAVYP